MRKNSGISSTNIVLMGALAALLLDRRLRERVIDTGRSAYEHGVEYWDDELRPALGNAATEAGRGARHLAEEGQRALSEWQQDSGSELLSRAQGFLNQASERASSFAREAQKELEHRAHDWEDSYQDVSKQARRLGRQGSESLSEGLEELQGNFLGFLSRSGDELDDRRRQLERDMKRARRDIERELRRSQKDWKPKQLEGAIQKKWGAVQKQAEREFRNFEKSVLKQRRQAERQARAEAGRGTGALVAVGLVAAGVIALARLPEARAAVLNGVEKVSPDARHHLERVGRSFKASVGEIWLEGEAPAPQPAPKPAPKPVASDEGAEKSAKEGNTSNTPEV